MRRVLMAAMILAPFVANAAPSCEGMPGEAQVTVQLFYGRAMKDGTQIDAAQWADYLGREVTPRFPAGLTVLEASGQWQQRATGKVIREKSTVVEIVTSPSAETWTKVAAVREAYKKRFAQESVGVVSHWSCAAWD